MNVDLRYIRLFLGTPTHDEKVTLTWLAGFVATQEAFHRRLRFDVHRCSFLPMGRDVLTQAFWESGCSHALFVDSDIGWTVNDIALLLGARQPFVAGCYAKKSDDRSVVAKARPKAERAWGGHPSLVDCEHVGAGFVLITRDVIAQMRDSYPELRYRKNGRELHAFWSTAPGGGRYDSEDIAFCRRWTAIGGRIWLHREVQLKHRGGQDFVPRTEPNLGATPDSHPPPSSARAGGAMRAISRWLKPTGA